MKNKIINYIFFPIYKGIVKQLKVDFITDDLVRLGKNNDGGYVVLKSSLKKYENLLSFGIAEDISFEKKFQEYNGCSINCFDPSIDGLPELMHKTTFFKLGIDSRNYGDYINLEKVLELSEINKDSKVFMKMDIEGFEWNIFEDNESFNLLKDFEQVVIELHMKYLLGKTKYFLPIALIKRFYILKKLRKHFYFYISNYYFYL